ncbi:MauE/DoxX family redox-associated membrane protein [Streptomyces sp. IBSBF 2435]|uniref:MauE/DoxX family redox-associated membrane protein n=1 Tax=Streptomyces sp. IBSBF 2435 TaxID=2903531 RepID=UPI002FDB9E60
MIPLVSNLAPLVCGLLLALTGAAKLFGRQTARLAANTVLVRVLNDGRRATLALRALGGLELALAAALLAAPDALLPGIATALLGAGFTGYLAYAKATAPESSCGCSASDEGPIGARSFTRAGLVMAGGVAAAGADSAWWSEISRRPGGSALVLAAAAVLLLGLAADLDRVWLVPLRKARIRVFGNPLPSGTGERVPVAATVQLLENSLAWQTAMPVVRSALLDHWDDEGWRVLRYAGAYQDERGTHPVSVLFALDLTLSVDTSPHPAVRVSLIDEETEEVVPASVLTPVPRRTVLPLAN